MEPLTVDRFGHGTNAFEIPFVEIGNPGNPPDPASFFPDRGWAPGPPPEARLGAVNYVYRIAKYEISNQIVEQADREGELLITTRAADPGGAYSSYWGSDRPATHLAWREWLVFVNWLNLSAGYHPAYRFNEFGEWLLWSPEESWREGPTNLYRHKDAMYFLSSADEWHKAAFYNPVAGVYYRYTVGNNAGPIPVPSGTAPGTAVVEQPYEVGPAPVDSAGGLSPYGTMAQGGNLMDLNESAYDASSDSVTENVHIRGTKWFFTTGGTSSTYSDPYFASPDSVENTGDCCTARIASRLAPAGDSDGDGCPDPDEIVAGTDALDATDSPALAVHTSAGGIILSFESVAAPVYGYLDPRRYYAIESCGDVAASQWTALAGYERILGVGGRLSVQIPSVGPGTGFFRLRVWLEAGISAQASRGIASVDEFGEGLNRFAMPFVAVEDEGAGGVGYAYRIAKHETSEDMVHKANALGGLGIAVSSLGSDLPASSMDWDAMARFVNWLNTSTGRQAAYSFDSRGRFQLWPEAESWQAGGTNRFRHKDAFYFLPSAQEWAKAGHFNGERFTEYPTGSDYIPTPVARGLVGGTAVYRQALAAGPSSVYEAGGLSHYGTMGQGGNVAEFIETEADGVNDSIRAIVQLRGGRWNQENSFLRLSAVRAEGMWHLGPTVGFRVASRLPGP